MVVKKEEPIVLNDVFISIQGLIFVSTWMGMTNLNNLASLSMDASMGSWVEIPSTSVILDMHETVSSRPNELFFLPEIHGAENYLHSISEFQCKDVEENHLTDEKVNEYLEYFIYVKEQCELNQPKTWREALNLYNQLIFHSNRH